MKKYKVGVRGGVIIEREILGETDSFYKIIRFNRRTRELKCSPDYSYFNSWPEAHEYLGKVTQMKIERMEQKLAEAKAELEAVNQMKNPSAA